MKDLLVILVFVIAIKLLGTINTPTAKDAVHKQVAKTEIIKANFNDLTTTGTLTHVDYYRSNLSLIVPITWVLTPYIIHTVSPKSIFSSNFLNSLTNAEESCSYRVFTGTEIYSDS